MSQVQVSSPVRMCQVQKSQVQVHWSQVPKNGTRVGLKSKSWTRVLSLGLAPQIRVKRRSWPPPYKTVSPPMPTPNTTKQYSHFFLFTIVSSTLSKKLYERTGNKSKMAATTMGWAGLVGIMHGLIMRNPRWRP